MESHQQQIINNFLDQVKEKLPGWLKDDSKESQELLNELNDHIWDKAEALAGDHQISDHHVHEAISYMGEPEKIAKEFKKRGTPKVYISEEWWDWYKKVLTIVMGILAGIMVLTAVLSIGDKNIAQIIIDFLKGLWVAGIQGFLVVTAIFVAMSMEGFLPQDFKDKAEVYREMAEKGEKTVIPSPATSHEYQQAYERAMGRQYHPSKDTSPSTEEFIYRWEEKQAKRKQKHMELHLEWEKKHKDKKKVKPPFNRGSMLSEAIWGTIWAIFFIIQPIEGLNQYFTPEFLEFIRVTSAISLAVAIIQFLRVFAGIQRVATQNLLQILIIVAHLLVIPILFEALDTPGILQIFANPDAWSGWITIMKVGLWIGIVGTIIEALTDLGKISQYRRKLERYNNRYNDF